MAAMQTAVALADRPEGPVTAETFSLLEVPVPEAGANDVLVEIVYLSVDPYMRGLIAATSRYAEGFRLGEPCWGRTVGRVAVSHHPDYAPGDWVFCVLPWTRFALARNGAGLRKVDPALCALSHYLGTMGFPGLTAWVGTMELGRPQPGETLFVSAASGAVGQVACQLGRLQGARVVGSAGSDEKCAFVRERCGADAVFNYRTAGTLAEGLAAACPEGIDVDFENVGGEMLEAVIDNCNEGARVVICGQISQYQRPERHGIRNLSAMTQKRLRMQGFIVRDHAHLLPTYLARMSRWLADGTVVVSESIREGLENMPQAFVDMMAGRNFGKQVVRIAEDPFRP